jgi:S1-C subfamily serine protease
MTSPFDDFEVEKALRPEARGLAFDLDRALDSLVILKARVPADAFTARTLGPERWGNGIVIGTDGLVLTIGYLITEAEEVTLIANDGRHVAAHMLGSDLPALPLGDSRRLRSGDPVILAGGGGGAHAIAARLIARQPFAGYWEYLLEEALFTGPGHPHWNGAALIGPSGALMGVGSLQMNQQLPDGRTPVINMSVPIELLPPILDDLSRGLQVAPPRPWLGLLSGEDGVNVVVHDVTAGGPAARAELRGGDRILAVAGEPIAGLADFYTKLWKLGPAGVTAPLRLKRDGDIFDVEIRTIDRRSRLKKPRFN